MPSLPTFRSVRRRRDAKNEKSVSLADTSEEPNNTDGGALEDNPESVGEGERERESVPDFEHIDVKAITKRRKHATIASSILFFLGLVFLIVVIIGQIYNEPVLTNIYFFKLDLTNIFPQSVPNAVLINSIARSIGLHDFYQVGLWGFCEGYNDEGITYCSPPVNLYWFNPVEILLNELLAGATIALPAEVTTILTLIRIVSRLMFGFFITSAVLICLSIPFSLLALHSKWYSLFLGLFCGLAGILCFAASVIATVMSVVFQRVITSQNDLNIGASLGINMFAVMWTATACVLAATFIQWGLGCCCVSRRDVRTGKKRNKWATEGSATGAEKSSGRSWNFLRRFREKSRTQGANATT